MIENNFCKERVSKRSTFYLNLCIKRQNNLNKVHVCRNKGTGSFCTRTINLRTSLIIGTDRTCDTCENTGITGTELRAYNVVLNFIN